MIQHVLATVGQACRAELIALLQSSPEEQAKTELSESCRAEIQESVGKLQQAQGGGEGGAAGGAGGGAKAAPAAPAKKESAMPVVVQVRVARAPVRPLGLLGARSCVAGWVGGQPRRCERRALTPRHCRCATDRPHPC